MSKDYKYYKDKYKAYTIRLDRQRDQDIIEYLDSCDQGPKACILHALRADLFVQSLGGLFKLEEGDEQ